MDGSTHPPSNTGSLTDHSLKKVKKAGAEKGWRYRSEGVVLKEPNVKEYAQNVKSYVKQKENYEKTIKQEKAAGRLGTKVRQIIKGFNNPKRK